MEEINNFLKRASRDIGKTKLPKGQYKYVYSYKMTTGEVVYQSYITKYKWSCYHETERAAAIAVDKKLLFNGEDPINILVRRNRTGNIHETTI
jgi:hypothetical protein